MCIDPDDRAHICIDPIDIEGLILLVSSVSFYTISASSSIGFLET